ncbi:unnamed protein product [Pedinophyceae sp. YPF-701]|nr:unnamed protein product [Pedinophyceae sp. YPF-701]
MSSHRFSPREGPDSALGPSVTLQRKPTFLGRLTTFIGQKKLDHVQSLRIEDLDARSAELLAMLDLDGSGTISLEELRAAADQLAFERRIRKRLTLAIGLLLGALIVLLLATFGVSIAAVELAKQVKASSDGTMRSAGGGSAGAVVNGGAGAVNVPAEAASTQGRRARARARRMQAGSPVLPTLEPVAEYGRAAFVQGACASVAAGHDATIAGGDVLGPVVVPAAALDGVCAAEQAFESGDESVGGATVSFAFQRDAEGESEELTLSCDPPATTDGRCTLLRPRPAPPIDNYFNVGNASVGNTTTRRRVLADTGPLFSGTPVPGKSYGFTDVFFAVPDDASEFYTCDVAAGSCSDALMTSVEVGAPPLIFSAGMRLWTTVQDAKAASDLALNRAGLAWHVALGPSRRVIRVRLPPATVCAPLDASIHGLVYLLARAVQPGGAAWGSGLSTNSALWRKREGVEYSLSPGGFVDTGVLHASDVARIPELVCPEGGRGEVHVSLGYAKVVVGSDGKGKSKKGPFALSFAGALSNSPAAQEEAAASDDVLRRALLSATQKAKCDDILAGVNDPVL